MGTMVSFSKAPLGRNAYSDLTEDVGSDDDALDLTGTFKDFVDAGVPGHEFNE